MNILIADLLAAAGPVMATALNALTPEQKAHVIGAHDDGGWCELRIGVMNEAAAIQLMLVNCDGAASVLGRFDHV